MQRQTEPWGRKRTSVEKLVPSKEGLEFRSQSYTCVNFFALIQMSCLRALSTWGKTEQYVGTFYNIFAGFFFFLGKSKNIPKWNTYFKKKKKHQTYKVHAFWCLPGVLSASLHLILTTILGEPPLRIRFSGFSQQVVALTFEFRSFWLGQRNHTAPVRRRLHSPR